MPLMEWSDKLELGLEPMDATHREFVILYNELAQAPADALVERLDAFITHTEAHFGQENRWMEAVNFPGCHHAEHDRVLAVLHDVRQRVERGDVFLGRRLIEELPAWFENHAAGMDAALAFHLETVGFDFAQGAVPAVAPGCSSKPIGGCACATIAATDGDDAPPSGP